MGDNSSVTTAEQTDERGVLAGVDEAGLGPVLGPLVVAGVTCEGPLGADPWKLLQRVVCRRKQSKDRIRVADSKLVHSGKYGRRYLERTALSFLGAFFGRVPESLNDLLTLAGVDRHPFRCCPWYGALDMPLPMEHDPGELELMAHRLQRALQRCEVQLTGIALRPVEVAEFNALIQSTDNKSQTHFHAYAEVIAALLGNLEGQAHLVADRCGGRMHYRSLLLRYFAGSRVDTLEEQPGLSRYRIQDPKRSVEISFAARGEERAFPTALASCMAKYLRESLMESLNRWFADRRPGLRRTAGYYTDGHRFLRDVERLPELDAEMRYRLVRVR